MEKGQLEAFRQDFLDLSRNGKLTDEEVLLLRHSLGVTDVEACSSDSEIRDRESETHTTPNDAA